MFRLQGRPLMHFKKTMLILQFLVVPLDSRILDSSPSKTAGNLIHSKDQVRAAVIIFCAIFCAITR